MSSVDPAHSAPAEIPGMPTKCARNGCHQNKDTTLNYWDSLGLCTHHHNQFLNGTLGQNENPANREFDITEAQTLIQLYNDEYHGGHASLRTLATELGVPKDTIANILNLKYKVLRSTPWLQLLDAVSTRLNQDTAA